MSPNTLIFTHIPKTAGSTLASIIRQEYGEQNTIQIVLRNLPKHPNSIIQPMFWNDFTKLSGSEKNKYLAIWGHIPFGLHQYLNQPCTYITMLRDPIELTISKYYFHRRRYTNLVNRQLKMPLEGRSALDATVKWFKLAVDLPLIDWLDHQKYKSNSQTSFLAGVNIDQRLMDWNCPIEQDKEHFSEFPERYLSIAKENLKTMYKVFGITEFFDSSLLLIQKELGWKIPLFYIRQNVTQKRPMQENIDSEVIQKIKNYNQVDIELYKFAKSYFQELIAKYEVTQEDVNHFQRINQIYQEKNTSCEEYRRLYPAVLQQNKQLMERVQWLESQCQAWQEKAEKTAQDWQVAQDWIQKLQQDKEWLEGELSRSVSYAQSLEKELESTKTKKGSTELDM